MILTEKQQKYQHYHLEKLINIWYLWYIWNIWNNWCLTVEEMLPSNQRQIIEQARFAYSLFEKAFEKQTEKQVGTLKSLRLSIKKRWIKTNWGHISTKFDEWFGSC